METLVVDGGHLEPVPGSTIAPNPVFWSAIIGGAIVAAALSSVLLAFGSAIGLAVVSTSPGWHDSSFALWFASGLYLVFVALAAFGCGGYIAGRLRPRHAPAPQPVEHDRQLRDGLRGLMSWALRRRSDLRRRRNGRSVHAAHLVRGEHPVVRTRPSLPQRSTCRRRRLPLSPRRGLAHPDDRGQP